MSRRKMKTRMVVEGLFMTEQRQAQVGQAVLITLYQQEAGMDGVTVTFETDES